MGNAARVNSSFGGRRQGLAFPVNFGRLGGVRDGAARSSSARGQSREEEFNFALGETLRNTRARWRANPLLIAVERTGTISGRGNAGKRPDILIIDPRLPPLVIECSFDAADANQDASARLGDIVKSGNSEVKTALSVYIPKSFRSSASPKYDLSAGAEIGFALYQKTDADTRRWPGEGFLQGKVADLSALLAAASLPKEDIERVADDVASLVDEAAAVLESLPSATTKKIDRRINRGSLLMSLKTTMVLWLNALLTQQRLHGQGVDVPSLDFASQTLPSHSAQIKIWRRIKEKNWNAIFDPAVEILEMAGNSDPRSTGRALEKLTEAVEKIENAGLGLHINVGAELFPKLSEDRKQAAAFYTQAATAELLAALTIRQCDLTPKQWADGNLFSDRSLADLACGTGTLLRAGYRRIQTVHELAGGTVRSLEELHRKAMETGLIGTDVSPIAAHLTSSSLAAIGMGKPYGKSQIGWLMVGGKTNATGSLDYFETQKIYDFMQEVAGLSTGGREIRNLQSVDIPDNSITWILMNPPYSRTRRGQSVFDIAGLTESNRKACQKRWGKLIKDEPANAKAGMAASFLALARRKIKPGGRIGFVLPLTAAFADTWTVTRQMIERNFIDVAAIVIAAGQALGNDALSADTKMEEMLLVATRRSESAERKEWAPIKCVTLYAPVTRPGEAGETARAISQALGQVDEVGASCPVRVGETEFGQICVFDPGGEGAPWGPLGVKHADLAVAAEQLTKGRLIFAGWSEAFSFGMTTLGEIFDVGPSHDSIGHLVKGDGRGAFKFFPVQGEADAIGADRSLWAADSKAQRCLVVPPTHKGVPVTGGKCEEMRAYRGRLFYARNMRWTSQALLAAMTKNDAMGGRAWTVLQYKDHRVCKAFMLWANSTLGMIVHWTRGQRTQSGRSTAQVKALGKIPCPRLDALGGPALDWVAARFDELASRPLLPVCQSHADETRREIDSVMADLLDMPKRMRKVVETLRFLWCREPSVHGRNQRALRLLAQAMPADRR